MFSAEFPYVWASLLRCGVRRPDAEDVAHDVFLRVYAKWETYDANRPLRPWLFGFAFRAASDYRRLARHRVEVLAGETALAAPAAPERLADEALSEQQEAELVQRALDAVDLDKRAVLVAYELDGAAMKDIAEALEVPLHTAYSRLRLARAEFARAVKRLRMQRGES